jgi:hypothetical protein
MVFTPGKSSPRPPLESAQAITGTLMVKDADAVLPEIRGFSIYPKEFSPNQDGIADRVRLNMDLKKDVEELQVYMLDTEDTAHYIPEDEKHHSAQRSRMAHLRFTTAGSMPVPNLPPMAPTPSTPKHVTRSDNTS